MELVLTEKDLEQIDKLIQETPFKYAFPLFQFLRSKVEQAQRKQEPKPPSPIPQLPITD
jgi:hypothetical protein